MERFSVFADGGYDANGRVLTFRSTSMSGWLMNYPRDKDDNPIIMDKILAFDNTFIVIYFVATGPQTMPSPFAITFQQSTLFSRWRTSQIYEGTYVSSYFEAGQKAWFSAVLDVNYRTDPGAGRNATLTMTTKNTDSKKKIPPVEKFEVSLLFVALFPQDWRYLFRPSARIHRELRNENLYNFGSCRCRRRSAMRVALLP